ncbi:LLM class flavin-dependent oxidoreductase [Corynebacterium freiburgense]|uniref:LLM class flavin-dependent oxidoreductase n=1 Tax=Corynebacterium freiburgense TaxID=556548 RepID=UPI00040710E2|nr:LLM class flavin-dependent oxidoreductase [Corynebacterium freiburgense]WJZ03905.1 hypothetical protein CFREI_13255 [Corynebacterium freiburgense]
MVAISVLDLVPVSTTPKAAVFASIAAAKIAEEAGYTRYWIGEYHNNPALACSATALLVSQIAAATSQIRVGGGGMTLSERTPISLAEDLGTLGLLYQKRVEAALSVASYADISAARKVRSHLAGLVGFYAQTPLCVYGSSLNTAMFAGQAGLPLAIASHIVPQHLESAIAVYRKSFVPSAQCEQPYVLASANIMVCDSRQEALFQFTTLQQMFGDAVSGKPGLISPPREVDMHPMVKAQMNSALSVSFVGTGPDVALRLQEWANAHSVDEVLSVTYAYDPKVREGSIKELGNWF